MPSEFWLVRIASTYTRSFLPRYASTLKLHWYPFLGVDQLMFASPIAFNVSGRFAGAGKNPGFAALTWATVFKLEVGKFPGGAVFRIPAATVLGRLAVTQSSNSFVSMVNRPPPAALERSTSIAPYQKSLFLMAGPPSVAPYSLRLNTGTLD